MKKIALFFVVLAALYCLCAVSYAIDAKNISDSEPSIEIVSGKIVSITTEKNEITVKDVKSDIDKIIVIDAKTIPSLKIDEEVIVEIKQGSNIAESVKKIK